MRKLPTEKEQHWLLVSLAALIKARGCEHFLTTPIVEPTREFFPDPWSYSTKGLDRVVRRLMQYAALGHLDVEIEAFSEEAGEAPSIEDPQMQSVAGLFLGIDNGRCLFGFNIDAPADDEYMVGVMCHEVAHAYRDYHSLPVEDRQEEELLTDLTACYLGFGILAANNSYRYRTSMDIAGGATYHYMSSVRTGYLPPQAYSYLLGLQMAVRDFAPGQRRSVYRHLEPNQAAYTRAAFEECQARSEDFLEILDLPPVAERPDPRPLQNILHPLQDFIVEEVTEAPEMEPAPNQGRPVFRVERTKAMGYCFLGIVTFGGLGIIISRVFDNPLPVLGLSVIGLWTGVLLGLRQRHDICSDPDCSAVLPSGASLCPDCGGTIMGRIASRRDRLGAEAQLEAQEREDRRIST